MPNLTTNFNARDQLSRSFRRLGQQAIRFRTTTDRLRDALDRAFNSNRVQNFRRNARWQLNLLQRDALGVARAIEKGLVNAFLQSGAKLKKFGSNARITLSNLHSHIFSLKSAFLGLATVLGIHKLKDFTIGANQELERYRITLTKVLGSQSEAIKKIEFAKEFAATTPFELPGIIAATNKLEIYGFQAEKWLPRVGDAAAIMGKSVDQAVEALADARTGEFERLKEFGIRKDDLQEYAKDELGLEIFDAKGAVSDFEGLIQTLDGFFGKQYGGGMQALAQSTTGAISNIKDVITNFGQKMGAVPFNTFTIRVKEIKDQLMKWKNSGVLDTIANELGVKLAHAMAFIIDNGIPLLVDAFKYALEVGKTFGTGFSDVVQSFKQSWGPVIEIFNETFNEVFPNGKEKIDELMSPLNMLKTSFELTAKFVRLTGDSINAMARFMKRNKEILIALGAGISAVAAGLFGLWLAIDGIILIKSIWFVTTLTLSGAMATLGTIFAALTSPISLTIAAIAALIAVGVYLWRNWDTVKAKGIEMWAAFANKFPNGAKFIKSIVSFIIDLFKGLIGFFKGVFTLQWGEAWQALKDLLFNQLQNIADFFTSFIEGIGNTLDALFNTDREMNVNINTNRPGGQFSPGPLEGAYRGTNFASGGKMRVAEKGPELITRDSVQDIPRGAKVISADNTRRLMSSLSGGGTTTTQNDNRVYNLYLDKQLATTATSKNELMNSIKEILSDLEEEQNVKGEFIGVY